jgi:hypothetical protein
VRPISANLKRSRLLVKNNYTFTINYKQLSLCRYYGVRVEQRYNSIHLTLPLNGSNQIHAPSALPLEKNTTVSIQQGAGWTTQLFWKSENLLPLSGFETRNLLPRTSPCTVQTQIIFIGVSVCMLISFALKTQQKTLTANRKPYVELRTNSKPLFSVRILKIPEVSTHKHTLNTAVFNVTTDVRRTMCELFPYLTVY